MKAELRVVAIVTILVLVNGRNYPVRDYQLLRPIKYFFHLLELKAGFNPMFSGLADHATHCSSKSGPFCRITGQEPFQTHSLKTTSMSEATQLIYSSLIAQRKEQAKLLQSILRQQRDVFLIRNELVNNYELVLKQKMGTTMHKGNMLPTEDFQTLE